MALTISYGNTYIWYYSKYNNISEEYIRNLKNINVYLSAVYETYKSAEEEKNKEFYGFRRLFDSTAGK